MHELVAGPILRKGEKHRKELRRADSGGAREEKRLQGRSTRTQRNTSLLPPEATRKSQHYGFT